MITVNWFEGGRRWRGYLECDRCAAAGEKSTIVVEAETLNELHTEFRRAGWSRACPLVVTGTVTEWIGADIKGRRETERHIVGDGCPKCMGELRPEERGAVA